MEGNVASMDYTRASAHGEQLQDSELLFRSCAYPPNEGLRVSKGPASTVVMRLVVWNCAMALHRKIDALMALRPDLAVIPEAAEPGRLGRVNTNVAHR